MKTPMCRPFGRVAFAGIISLFFFVAPRLSQEETRPNPPQATTVSDVEIPLDHLHVILRPLTQDELQVELDAWMELLRSKIRVVGDTELQLKALGDNESTDALTEQLISIRTEERAIVERSQTVIDALKAKGGDVQTAEQFVTAVSAFSETTDTASFQAAVIAEITNWASRDDGGKLLAKRAMFALVILFISWVISKFAGRIVAKALSRHLGASNLLENFARRTTGGVVFVVGFVMSLGVLGFEIGPMMAALGAGGFIVGFAMQETLSNFASGMMIMVYRPFDLNDYVSVAGVDGTVKKMSLVSTTLLTPDNKVLVIPNKKAWSDTIVNFTGQDSRRVDLVFGIGYDDDIQQATNVLLRIAGEHPMVLDEPPVRVEVKELGDSSVNLLFRPWVKTENYWTVYWELTRQVKDCFDAEAISFPFPQRDVHLQSGSVD